MSSVPPVPVLERSPTSYVFSVLVIAACVLLDSLLYPHVSESDLVMALLVGVLLVARLSSRSAAFLAAVLGVASFDVLFVEPRFTFAVADTRYLITFAVMAATGLVLATTTARLRRQAQRAWERSQQLRALNDLAQALVGVDDRAEVARAVHRHVEPALGRAVRLELDPRAPVDPRARVLPLGLEARLVVNPAPADPWRDDEETLHTLASQLAVTLQRITDADARQLAELEAERERLRNALLSSVSHDLRTPLAAIVGAASTLLEGGPNDEPRTTPTARAELLQTIRDETDRLARLLDNLLQMTRIEGGGVRVHWDWEAPEELVAAVLERVRARSEDHTLRARIAAEPGLVPCNATLIELVLLNLVDNALAHTPPGSTIEIRGELRSEGDGEVYVLEVADDGPGVPPAERERIFEKFVRGPGAGPRGVGLGLAICRAAARAHGGDAVAVGGDGDRGLVVRVMLPYQPAPIEPAPSPA
jgi:two-component system, OmpR family, sensor histidine kinase KdpD